MPGGNGEETPATTRQPREGMRRPKLNQEKTAGNGLDELGEQGPWD